MLKTLLGPELFRKGMDLYFDRHDGEAATVEQFVQCFADVGRPRFLAVHALVLAGRHARGRGQRRTTRRRTKTYRLEVTQTVPPTPGQPDKEPMVIPLAVGLVGRDGADLPLDARRRGARARHHRAEQVGRDLRVHRRRRAPVPSLNRGFSAPIRLGSPIEPTTCASSPPTTTIRSIAGRPCRRWRCRSWPTTSRRCAPARGAQGCGLAGCAGRDPRRPRLEPAFVALVLTPPGEADIAREIGRDIDPDAIFAARSALRAAIGERLGAALSDTLSAHVTQRPLPARCGRRRPARAAECLPRSAGGGAGRPTRSRSRLRSTRPPTT